MTVSEVLKKMILYSDGNTHDINYTDESGYSEHAGKHVSDRNRQNAAAVDLLKRMK